MANIIDSLSNVVSVTNSKADQLTTLAKGVLCLPAILRGSVGSSESILKGILAGATQTIASLSNTVRTLIANTIQDQVSRLTGAATRVVNTIQGAIASIAATYETVKVIISDEFLMLGRLYLIKIIAILQLQHLQAVLQIKLLIV